MRDVVAHLLVIDEMIVRGGALRAWSGIRRLEHPGAWDLRRIRPLAELEVAELVTALAQRGERFARLVGAAPAAVRRVSVSGPFGRVPLSCLIGRRVLHEWLHEHDIAVGTATPPPDARGAVAGIVTEAVLHLLAVNGLPRVGRDEGVVRLVVDLGADDNGWVRRCIWGIDFGRRQYGPRVVTPAHAAIRLDATTLALLGNGRQERVAAEAAPLVEGDRDLADALVAALTNTPAPVPCLALAAAA